MVFKICFTLSSLVWGFFGRSWLLCSQNSLRDLAFSLLLQPWKELSKEAPQVLHTGEEISFCLASIASSPARAEILPFSSCSLFNYLSLSGL